MNRMRAAALVALLLPTIAFAADDQLAKIGEMLKSGRPQEARIAAVRECDAFAAASDAVGEASAWLLIGAADMEQGNLAAGRQELEIAAAKFTAAGDTFGAWTALLCIAYVETSNGNYEPAIVVHEQILRLLRDASDPKAPFSIGSVKLIGKVFGMDTNVLGPLAEFPEFLKPLLLRFIAVVSHDTYAGALLEVGEIEKAEEQLKAATDEAALFGGLFDGTMEVHRATLLLRQWHLDEARESYVKALRGAKAMIVIGDAPESVELRVMRRLATLEVLSGRTDEGLAWNDRALDRVRAAVNIKGEIDLLQERAALLRNAGRYEDAFASCDDALRLAADYDEKYRIALIHTDLGQLHMFQGTYGSAVEHLQKSIDLFQKANEPYLETVAWSILGQTYLLLASPDSAELALDQARTLARKSHFRLAESFVNLAYSARDFVEGRGKVTEAEAAIQAFLDMPEVRAELFSKEMQQMLVLSLGLQKPDATRSTGLGHAPPLIQALFLTARARALMERGEYTQAREVCNEALALHPNRDHIAGLHALVGASYWKEGKNDEAIRSFRKAVGALETVATDVKVEELLAGYLGSNRRWYFSLLVDMLVSEGQTEEAFAQAERARARAFLQLVGNHRFNAERGADPRLVEEAETLRTHIIEREREAGQATRENARRIEADLERERQRYRTVMTRVKVSNPEYAMLTNVEPVEIDAVQKELPADATLISYFVTAHAAHAWTVNRDTAHHTLLPLPPASLQRIVCWAAQFGPRDDARGVVRPTVTCSDAASEEEAYDALIAPLVKDMRTAKLILVPHGVLHYVPFAALRNRATGRYLIEDYTLTFAPSASALHFLRAKETPITGGALVLGDPASPLPGLKKLPFAKEEATGIAGRLGAKAHIGADAREALVYRAGGKADLVHLAAHGLYDGANPLFSRIALAPGDAQDGSLTVHEILSSVDLTGVNLVVLSACVSAVGARSGGDEVVGLTRALLYAGTPGVISTLWNIDDAASAGLMNAFYRRLADGDAVADALRQAQLEVMHSEQHRHPKYWAAFMLTGDPQGRWKPVP